MDKIYTDPQFIELVEELIKREPDAGLKIEECNDPAVERRIRYLIALRMKQRDAEHQRLKCAC